MSHDRSTPDAVKMERLGRQGNPRCAVSHSAPAAPLPGRDVADLPDDVWEVFRLDPGELEDEPQPGDFWLEPDESEEP